MWHLPDIPNAGYSTRNQREASDSMMDFLRKIERDRVRLLTIVVDGPDKFKRLARDIWRGSEVATEEIDGIWRYLLLMAAKPVDQRRLLDTERNAAQYRDVVTSVMPDIERQLHGLLLQRKWAP